MCLHSPYLIYNEQRFPEPAVTSLGCNGHDYVYSSLNKMFGGPGADFQEFSATITPLRVRGGHCYLCSRSVVKPRGLLSSRCLSYAPNRDLF